MSGHYATNGQVARFPLESGIEITRAQYKAAIAAMQVGKIVEIVDGQMQLNDPPPPPEPEE